MRIATPAPTAQPTPSSLAVTDSPLGAGIVAEPPLGAGAGQDPLIPVALIAAAVAVLVLVRLARRRMLPAVDGGQHAAVPALPAPPAPDARRVTPQPEPTGEEHLPRWRRPSVVAARFETVNTAASKAAAAAALPSRLRPPKRFASGAEVDRRVLRYDGVVLLDRPDDVHGRPMEGLQADDEVALLERDELWANVATPGGRAGWIPAMALGPATPTTVDPRPAVDPSATDHAGPAVDPSATVRPSPAIDPTLTAARSASSELTPAREDAPGDETVIDSLLTRQTRTRRQRT